MKRFRASRRRTSKHEPHVAGPSVAAYGAKPVNLNPQADEHVLLGLREISVGSRRYKVTIRVPVSWDESGCRAFRI